MRKDNKSRSVHRRQSWWKHQQDRLYMKKSGWEITACKCNKSYDIVVNIRCTGQWADQAGGWSDNIWICSIHGWLTGISGAGETQTVDTLIKCISVASANDACVTMAEYICGNEEEFVTKMNKRAKDLGMKNTHFVNCNGLDADGHLTTARDIALMSKELITTYPQIFDYCNIWMENIIHKTQKGESNSDLRIQTNWSVSMSMQPG